jgi:MbtH protein
MSEEADDARPCIVVTNDEGQYAIWPSGRPIPVGWRSVGITGDRGACLSYIERVWTDITPLSVRRRVRESLGAVATRPARDPEA